MNLLRPILDFLTLPKLLARLERLVETLTERINKMDTDLDAKFDELDAAIAKEFQQLRDAISASGAGKDAIAQVDRAKSRVQAAIDALKSDDEPVAETAPPDSSAATSEA